MSDIILTIKVDRRISEYANYLTTEQGAELGYRTESPKLLPIVARLLQDWRSTSYLAGMPAMYVISQEKALEGFVKDDVNDTTLLALTDFLLTSLTHLVPELANDPVLAKKLNHALIIQG